MTKREAPQLDFDETIYVEMAHESGGDNTRKNKVCFNLLDNQGQRPPVKFTVTMNNHQPTASTPPPTTGNQHPLTKN